MATASRTTKTQVEKYDFDAFDAEAEDAAIAQIAENSVKYIIVEKTFVGRFASGTIVKVPLDITVSIANGIDEDAAGNPIDQLQRLFELIGDEESAKTILAQGLVESVVFATKYFTVLQKITKASLPE